MTKDEARREALRQWRALPVMQRQTFEQAAAFAATIEPTLPFHTVGVRAKIIAAWLQRDQIELAAAAEAVRLRSAKV